MSRRSKAQRFLKPRRKPRREPGRFAINADGRPVFSLDGPADVPLSRGLQSSPMDDYRARARALSASVSYVGPFAPSDGEDGRGVIVWRSWLEQVLALLHEIGDE